MPKTKKETEKKTVSKKPRVKRATSKKTATAKTSSKPKSQAAKEVSPKPKAQAITIDVIADDEDILVRSDALELPADNIEERESLDVQKKFFSELVNEMKDKNNPVTLSSELPIAKEHRAHKSLHLYRRIALQFIVLTAFLLLVVAYFFLPNLKIVLHPSAETVVDSLPFEVISTEDAADMSEVANSRSLTGDVKVLTLKADKVYETSGEEILGEEIVGEVTLHNEYTKDQPLVVNTRLLSEDNKLFRLKEAVLVPAGGSVQVAIYADKVSEEMAIAPTHFTIPGLWLGLQDKIYATSDQAFEYQHQIKKYVKQRDLDQAITDIKKTLLDKADQAIANFSQDEKAIAYSLDNSSLKFQAEAKLGEELAEFTVSAENNLLVVAFDKEKAESLVKAKLAFLLPDDKKLSAFNGDDVSYRLDSFDAENNTAMITASFKGLMSLRTDADIIDRRQLVNLKEEQISEYLHTFPEIESYDLKFFPGFLKKAPSLADRIKVSVD